MKNSQEYTNADPLVKAAYDVIAAKKSMEAAEAAAKLEEAVKPNGGGFDRTVDIGGIDYKTQLDRVVKLIKKERILKSDKDITSFLESGFGRELGEIIVGQHARLSPAARTNDAPLTSFLKKKLPIWDAMEEESIPATWAEGAHEPLNLPNEKELAMVITQLNFVCHASAEIRDILTNGGSYPEWFQNKLSGLHSTMQDLHSYILGKESGNLKEMTKAKLDKTNKISSDEYSKLRKKPYFNAADWKFSDKDMLYHRIVEETEISEAN